MRMQRPANRRRASRRRGFTLLEVLLVVGILVALAAIALPNLIGVQEDAKIKEAKLQVNTFYDTFKMYNIQFSQFPPTEQGFQALLSPPNGKKPLLEMKNNDLSDPWGQPYQYEYPGRRNTSGGPDVWSSGPDRQSGSADDIGNWASAK